jgi:hypothetical protein
MKTESKMCFKKSFCLVLALFTNFEAIYILHQFPVCETQFCQKGQNRCTLLYNVYKSGDSAPRHNCGMTLHWRLGLAGIRP